MNYDEIIFDTTLPVNQRRAAFLEDMIEYYSKDPVSRRCINDENNSCFYSPTTVSKEGLSEGCAIGRKLPKEVAERIDSIGCTVGVVDLDEEDLGNLFSLGTLFLSACQDLHDSNSYWNAEGLTVEGKSTLANIKQNYL